MIVKKTEALTALSLTAAVVRFANAGENLIAIATRLKRDNIASQAEIQQLSKCLEDFRDLSPHRETSQAYDSHLFEDLDCQKAEDVGISYARLLTTSTFPNVTSVLSDIVSYTARPLYTSSIRSYSSSITEGPKRDQGGS